MVIIMELNDLETYSTEELINELMGRVTFQGVLVYSAEEVKRVGWNGEKMFKVRYNSNLTKPQMVNLLEQISIHLDQLGE